MQIEALQRAIEAQRQTDPLIGAKLGAREVLQKLLQGMKGERWVHAESLLCALGALAGYACQASLRAQALAKGLPEASPFITVQGPDGTKTFFGDALNQALVEGTHSVWSLAAGGAQQLGCLTLPDVKPIFEHVVQSAGTASFGLPRLPEGRVAGDTPVNYVKALWPALLPTLTLYCKEPSEWPQLFGGAVQEAMTASKAVLAPEVALLIVMECAIPMSKVDLGDGMTVGNAAGRAGRAVAADAPRPKTTPAARQDNPFTRNRWARLLLGTNEGRIFVFGSALYLAIALLVKVSPAVAAAFGVIGFFALYMPLFLLVFLHQFGVLRKGYVSSRFNTGCLLLVALTPFIVVGKLALFR
ncbi:MAG TPA: hypothetical protein VK195_20080 [Burkholderiaceae bacterium]|nr:hypothetical protein [Burkholderiaceae bacterium]